MIPFIHCTSPYVRRCLWFYVFVCYAAAPTIKVISSDHMNYFFLSNLEHEQSSTSLCVREGESNKIVSSTFLLWIIILIATNDMIYVYNIINMYCFQHLLFMVSIEEWKCIILYPNKGTECEWTRFTSCVFET